VLSLSPAVRVFVAVEPLDMRGNFDALAGAVRRLGLDPVDGHLYLFLNKRRRLAKALWFDGSGWCILAKRLEAGSFQLPPFGETDSRVEVDGNTFAAIIAGIDFTAARRGWFRRPNARGGSTAPPPA
jgi:transposase